MNAPKQNGQKAWRERCQWNKKIAKKILKKKKKFNVPKKSKFILKQHWEHGLACYIGKSKSFPSLSNVKKKHKLSLIYKAGRGINWY